MLRVSKKKPKGDYHWFEVKEALRPEDRGKYEKYLLEHRKRLRQLEKEASGDMYPEYEDE